VKKGIYELNGDVLKICIVIDSEERPTGFATAIKNKWYTVSYEKATSE
jgi:hypothetical protein